MTVKDIEEWEKQHGKIPEGCLVAFRSDWCHVPSPETDNLDKCPLVDTLIFLTFPRLKDGMGFPAQCFAMCPKS